MTWKELAEQITALPADVQAMDAAVGSFNAVLEETGFGLVVKLTPTNEMGSNVITATPNTPVVLEIEQDFDGEDNIPFREDDEDGD